jgi:hypothetical protein
MEIVGENWEKSHFLQKQGFYCYGSPWQAYSRRGEGLCSVWLAMRVFGWPWRELQVLTRIFAMASEILAMAS